MYSKYKFTIFNSLFHLIVGMGFSITIGYGNPILSSLGFSSSGIGVVYALSMLFGIFLQSGISILVENKRFINTIQSIRYQALACIIFGALMFQTTSNHMLSAIVFLIALAVSTAGFPTLAALSMECINAGKELNFGIARSMGSIGYSALGFFAGYYLTIFTELSLFYIFIILNFILYFLTFFYPKQEYINVKYDSGADTIMFMLKENRIFRLLILGTTLIFFSHNIINNFLKNIIDYVGATSIDYGIAVGISSLLELPTMIFFALIIKKFDHFTLLKISAFFMMSKVVIETLSATFSGIFLAQFTQPLGFAIFAPAIVFCMNDIVKPANRVKAQLMVGVATTGISGVIGNIIGGVLVNFTGINNTLIVSSIVSFIGVTIFFKVDRLRLK